MIASRRQWHLRIWSILLPLLLVGLFLAFLLRGPGGAP